MSAYLLTYWTLFDHLVDYNPTSLIRSCPSCMATTCLKLCSAYERLKSSSLSPSSLRLSSLRTTDRSSLRHKSLVRIYAVHRSLCRSSLKKVCADPNPECSIYSYPPVAQNIHSFPTVLRPATLLARDSAGQAFWQKTASGVPNTYSTQGPAQW